MWWRIVIDHPHNTFDNCHSQGVALRWAVYGFMCNPHASKFVAISIFMIFFNDHILLRIYFSSQE